MELFHLATVNFVSRLLFRYKYLITVYHKSVILGTLFHKEFREYITLIKLVSNFALSCHLLQCLAICRLNLTVLSIEKIFVLFRRDSSDTVVYFDISTRFPYRELKIL